jgi:hypothetical protein
MEGVGILAVAEVEGAVAAVDEQPSSKSTSPCSRRLSTETLKSDPSICYWYQLAWSYSLVIVIPSLYGNYTISASSHHLCMVISSIYSNTNYISRIDRMEWITYYNFFLACLGGFKQYMQGVTHPPLRTYLD